MTKKEKEIFDLTVDIDFAPLSVQLSLEDRKTLANTLLKLGYKKEIRDNLKRYKKRYKMKHLKKYRYISCGIAKSTDKISDFRLIGGSQLFPEERVVLRVVIPDDLKLSKYSCDNYSTTEDPRTLEELGCDVMIRINGRWIIKNDLKPLSINEIYDLKEIKNGNKNN